MCHDSDMKTDNEIIDALGGTGAVAKMCGLADPTVSTWRKRRIPKSWARYFQSVRPDLYDLPPVKIKRVKNSGNK